MRLEIKTRVKVWGQRKNEMGLSEAKRRIKVIASLDWKSIVWIVDRLSYWFNGYFWIDNDQMMQLLSAFTCKTLLWKSRAFSYQTKFWNIRLVIGILIIVCNFKKNTHTHTRRRQLRSKFGTWVLLHGIIMGKSRIYLEMQASLPY